MKDKTPLSPVYLDNEPVEVPEAQPRVAAIVAAGGKRKGVRVVRLTSRFDMEGSPLGPDDVIDRTEVTPVYLKTTPTTDSPPSAPGLPGPHWPDPPGPPPLPPMPEPEPTPIPDPIPPGPLPPDEIDPNLRDVERAGGDSAEGQVE